MVKSDKDSVAVLVATYNGEKYIKDQLLSILNQKKVKPKIYVHDDFSTDDTLNIIKRLIKKYPENIFLISSEKRLGVIKTYQFLLDRVESDYYFFSDQDDIWFDEKVYDELTVLKKSNKEPRMVYTDLMIVDSNLQILNPSMFKKMKVRHTEKINRLLIQNVITGNTVAFNKKLRDLIVSCFRMDSQNIRMHDGWFGLVAATYGNLEFIDKPTVYYRQHGNNVVGAKKTSFLKKIFEYDSMKQSVYEMIYQGKYLENRMFNYNKVNNVSYRTVLEYSRILKYKKMKRLKTLVQYSFWKQGFLRNFAFAILIMSAKRESDV